MRQDVAPRTRGPIDVHHHLLSPQMLAKRRGSTPFDPRLDEWTPARSIELMDKNGVRATVVSVSTPGIWFGNADEAARLARTANEFAAGMARDYPGRFGFFAALALPNVDASLREIEYAFDTLKADGIGLLSSYDGRYLGDPAFAPVFDEMQRRRTIVHVHPAEPQCCTNVVPNVPMGVAEFGFDTTRAVTNLLYSGTLKRCPDVRFILSHGGGTVPFLAGRIAQRSAVTAVAADTQGRMAELKKLYFDTSSVTNASALASLLKLVPATQVMFGSDYPNATARALVDSLAELRQLVQSGDITNRQLQSIESDTAVALFPRLRG